MASYDPASVAFNGVRIKSEPKDDDDVEMLDARPTYVERFPRNLYNQERAISSKRAKDVHGHVFPTMCFHRVHLDHPHHHILRCSHDIITRGIEPCGGNCMLSTEAESKPFTKVFECPHPTCVKQQATMRRKVVGRRCNLSHVYGRDLEADAARREQKIKYEAMDRVPMREKVFKNKRSPSPEASVDRIPGPTQPAPPKAQLGGRVAKVLTEINYDRNSKAVDTLAVGIREGLQDAQKHLPPMPDDELEGHECDCCDGGVSDVRYHCKNCEADFGDDLDLCAKCFKDRKRKSWARKPPYHTDNHSFVRVVVGPAAVESSIGGSREHHDQDFELLETYCICESKYLEHMLECDKCGKPHHLGCVGEGLFSDLQYRGEDADEYHEEDMVAYKSRLHQTPFLCLACKFGNRDSATEDAALKQLHDDLANLRRAKHEKHEETRKSSGKAPGKKRDASEISTANVKKRAALDNEGPEMDDLFGEEDGQDDVAVEARAAKCAKTGQSVPTFGQFTVSMRN